MTTDPLPVRAARCLIVVSTLLAVCAAAWLSRDGFAAWILILLCAGLAGGRWAPRPAAAVILAAAPVWPLAIMALRGAPQPRAGAAWLAALIGMIAGGASWSRWHAPVRWQLPLTLWGLVLALGWPIVLARELDFTLVTYGPDSPSNSLWTTAARDAAAFATEAAAAAAAMLLLFDWLWRGYGRRDAEARARFLSGIAGPLTAGSVAAMILGLYQGVFDIAWMNTGVWPSLHRAGGALLDGNAFGALAALWGTTMALSALQHHGVRRAGGAALLLLAAGAVWASGSRTALLAQLAIGGAWLLGVWRTSSRSRGRIAAMAIVVAMTAALAMTGGGPDSPAARLWQTLPAPTMAGLETFARELWRRGGYATAADQMWRDFPWTGVGPGSFQLLSVDYVFLMTGAILGPDNAQNWWRQQWAELGLLGAVPAMVCSWLLIAAAARAWRTRDAHAWLPAAAVVASGGMALVGPPMLHPIVAAIVAVLVFWVTRETDDAAGVEMASAAAPASSDARVAAALCLLPLIWAAATAHAAVTELRPPYRAERTGWLYAYGFSTAEPAPAGMMRRAERRAVAVIPAAGPRLVLSLDAPDADAARPLHVRVSSRHAVICDVTRRAPGRFTCELPVPAGQGWMMVQLDTDRAGALRVAE